MICLGYREEESVLAVMKLLIESGFPNSLLLHECKRYNMREDVLDTANREKWESVDEYLLSDVARVFIFLSSPKRAKRRKIPYRARTNSV